MTWTIFFKFEIKQKYFQYIKNFLLYEKIKGKKIFPEYKNIFKAFKLTPFNKVKVLILGQDPYHQPNNANGLAFSVNKNCKIPTSLRNIFQELKNSYPNFHYKNGDLSHWAKQGVLLLNSILTVEYNKPLSHKNIGWEILTKHIFLILNRYKKNIIYVLWGKYAQNFSKYIIINNNYLLNSSHPSNYSCFKGFNGCKHFNLINYFLKKNNSKTICWNI